MDIKKIMNVKTIIGFLSNMNIIISMLEVWFSCGIMDINIKITSLCKNE